MYGINMNDPMVKRNRKHIREQVERFRGLGKSEEEIVNWIERNLDCEIGLYNNFDSVQDLAEYVNLPISKFNIFWI